MKTASPCEKLFCIGVHGGRSTAPHLTSAFRQTFYETVTLNYVDNAVTSRNDGMERIVPRQRPYKGGSDVYVMQQR